MARGDKISLPAKFSSGKIYHVIFRSQYGQINFNLKKKYAIASNNTTNRSRALGLKCIRTA